MKQAAFSRHFPWRTFAVSTLATLVLVLLFAAVKEFASERLLVGRNPARGRMVNVGEYRLHLNCRGDGPFTVILEAGLGDSSLVWHDVQQAISRFTRACSYDRAGMGWSDRGRLPRDPLNETTELHLLLERGQIARPVILVGHSFGGDLARLYASRFTTDVAGVLLVEPSNEDKWNRIPGLVAEWEVYRRDCRWDSRKARIGWLRFEHQSLADYPASVRSLAEALSYAPKAAAANCDEIHSMIGKEPAQVAQARTLGEIPLIVVTAGQNIFTDDSSLRAREEAGRIWKELQKETATLSSRGVQVVAEHSGHFVQHDEPSVVVSQVRRLVEHAEVQGRKR